MTKEDELQSIADELLEQLKAMVSLDDPETRRKLLLKSIEQRLFTTVPSSPSKFTELETIVDYANSWGRLDDGRWALRVI